MSIRHLLANKKMREEELKSSLPPHSVPSNSIDHCFLERFFGFTTAHAPMDEEPIPTLTHSKRRNMGVWWENLWEVGECVWV